MMDFFKSNKLVSVGVGILLLGIGYYLFFMQHGSTAPVTVTDSAGTSPVSQNLLVTLANLRTIKLNDSIFRDPAFQSLTDFGVVIPPEPAGRRNPFETFSGTASTQISSAAASIKLPLSGH